MGIHRAAVTEIIIAPNTVQQIIPAENLVAVLGQRPQKLHLFFRQRHLLVSNTHIIFIKVNVEPAILQHISPGLLLHIYPAHNSTHSGHNLAGRKRLDYIIVSANIQAHNLVIILASGGNHNNRHHRNAPQLAAHLKAINLRHHNIQKHHLYFLLLLKKQSRASRPSRAMTGSQPSFFA
ncbi:hypothetical protein EVA_13646 [gut metagenome]|uniref:Uncharacterized protein n=1 Tax=gut metagenome TaxID=749906 RepID=J9FTG5_9ZZZZ